MTRTQITCSRAPRAFQMSRAPQSFPEPPRGYAIKERGFPQRHARQRLNSIVSMYRFSVSFLCIVSMYRVGRQRLPVAPRRRDSSRPRQRTAPNRTERDILEELQISLFAPRCSRLWSRQTAPHPQCALLLCGEASKPKRCFREKFNITNAELRSKNRKRD